MSKLHFLSPFKGKIDLEQLEITQQKKNISGDISRHLCVCIGVVAIRQEDKGRVDGSEADGCVVIKHTELRQ